MRKLPRRQFLHLAAGAAALPVLPRIARAQAYPARPVRLIIGIAPGSGPDIIGRLFGQWLSDRLGRPFIIENRPGAGGNIATEAVVRSPADGYTLLLVLAANTVNATLYEKLNFNFISDIAPVASISRENFALEVNPLFPAKSIPEFIAYAKANAGKLSMASPGSGTAPHMAGELFKMMAGVDLVHVPYRGSAPALTDLIGGQVHVTFGPLTSSIQYVRAGTLRALAVSSASRSDALPDVPTIGDFVPGYEATGWFGVGVPRGTPAAIIDKVNGEINAAFADAKIKTRLSELGATPMPGSPREFSRLIADETEKWGKVVKFAGIKAE
jgi:tripartite-type tricarboxylate transporter receptor subunit TctC